MNRIEQACEEAGITLADLWAVERDGSYFQSANLPAGVEAPTWGPQDTARVWAKREDAEVKATEELGGRVVKLEVTEFLLFRQWRAAVAAEHAAERAEAEARERAAAARRNTRAMSKAFGLAALLDVPHTSHSGRSGWYVLGEELVYISESSRSDGAFDCEVRPTTVTRIRPQA